MVEATVPPVTPTGIDSTGRVEREITFLLRRTLENVWSSGYGEAPVDRFTYPVLALLDSYGPQGLGELTRRLGISKPTTSRHVARLAEAALVTSRPDPRDVRAMEVTLSERGAAVVARLRAARHAHLAAVLADWSDEDRDGLATLLARLNADLDRHA
jgi:DNA-binding MarR family transcriptional regulator